MSKNIPKPIVRIGHSIKKNGTIVAEIDGNKIKNMSVNQFTDLITELTKVRRKLVSMRGSASFDGVLTADQYDEIETMLKDEQGFIPAVKLYKEYADVGLYEAKQYVSGLRDSIKVVKRVTTPSKMPKPIGKRKDIQELKQLVADGYKLRAVKRYKEMSGLGLKEAKEFIDTLCVN